MTVVDSESRALERFTLSASGGTICLVKASLNRKWLQNTQEGGEIKEVAFNQVLECGGVGFQMK